MKKTAIVLMIITVVSKVMGFVRDMILSYFYGASGITDAYLISLTIPAVIFSFIGIGISTGYIPMFYQIEKDHGEQEAEKYTNNLISITFILCTIVCIFGIGFTEYIVKIFASGFEGDILSLAIKLTRISIFGIYFTAVVYIFSGYLQIKGDYFSPAITGFPFNFFVIIAIFLSYKRNILMLAIGTVVATASQLLVLIPSIHKKGYRYKFNMDTKDIHIKEMACMALPVTIGASVNQINILVDRTIASSIATGGISALDYASKLTDFVYGLFVVSISTVIYPVMSKMVTDKNVKGLKKSVSEAITSISILVIPATVGFIVFASPIVDMLFGRGEFKLSAISMTSRSLIFYSIGMLGIGFRDILSRAFYAMQDTRTPMINALIGTITNIVLNIILSKTMGIGGLALATSISATLCSILLFISLRKKIGPFGVKNITISFIKVFFSSLIMWIFFIIVKLPLIPSVVFGSSIYALTIYFMRIKEVDNMIVLIKSKLKK